MPAGYSGTPLIRKLGIKENQSILLYNPIECYFSLFSELPLGLKLLAKTEPESADFIHLFCKTFSELKDISNIYKTALKKDGLMWVSWPKGGSNIPTDLKRDLIREHFLQLRLVDIKVAAIDVHWSGLKLVYRLNDRKEDVSI
ncbi:DUF3052 domain-containing protein [Flavobacteriaceae bacterium F89]|uniref:DUF3052 domain-containing protein n=1 Tax=Cerina litoralis TaxID=2874477 RepID=A0AAE3JQ23_9FLAO|nr:DUF3052 domain-containing protein [Cerina litoralis]MCG2459778.1 DUF3052 domain-containing protein [Cerina litoralis]